LQPQHQDAPFEVGVHVRAEVNPIAGCFGAAGWADCGGMAAAGAQRPFGLRPVGGPFAGRLISSLLGLLPFQACIAATLIGCDLQH
jgi:hypothetical protein